MSGGDEMAELTWAEPPRRTNTGRRRHPYLAEVAALQANPTRWALLKSFTTPAHGAQLAYAINTGRLRAFATGRYEATARSRDGRCDVYVRYLGAKTPEPAVGGVEGHQIGGRGVPAGERP